MSGGKVDAVLVRRHLAALDAALKNLRRHRGRPLDELRTDHDHRWAVERGLQISAQCVLDIATHLAAAAGRDVPDYASALDEVGRLGILPVEFIARFRGIAGFRNVLVHGYLAVDPGQVHRLLNDRLEDFDVFADAVEAYLRRPA